MPKIGFWNLRRLGAASDETKVQAVRAAIRRSGVDFMFLCELVGPPHARATPYLPTPQNLTYRRSNPRQLCYGCVDRGGANVPLNLYTPRSTAEYRATGRSRINNFTRLADRGVARLDSAVSGLTTDLYAFHSRASNSAAIKAVAFLVGDLRANGGPEWALLGDLNVEPARFNSATGSVFNGNLRASRNPTYLGRRVNKEYDYAFASTPHTTVDRIRRSIRSTRGDHYPILLNI